MTTPQKLSLNQAAKSGKVAKTTLLNALKRGEITGAKTDNGQWEINPAELGRWLDGRARKLPQNVSQTISIPRSETEEKPPQNYPLDIEVQQLRERLADKDDVIADLRQRLDDEGSERRRLVELLTDQRAKSETEVPHRAPEKPVSGFGSRLWWLVSGKS